MIIHQFRCVTFAESIRSKNDFFVNITLNLHNLTNVFEICLFQSPNFICITIKKFLNNLRIHLALGSTFSNKPLVPIGIEINDKI